MDLPGLGFAHMTVHHLQDVLGHPLLVVVVGVLYQHFAYRFDLNPRQKHCRHNRVHVLLSRARRCGRGSPARTPPLWRTESTCATTPTPLAEPRLAPTHTSIQSTCH